MKVCWSPLEEVPLVAGMVEFVVGNWRGKWLGSWAASWAWRRAWPPQGRLVGYAEPEPGTEAVPEG